MIIDTLKQLESTSSRLEKESILNREKNNMLLKKAFFLAYDPFTQFYQRKIPSYTNVASNQADSLDSVLDSLYVLSTRQVTGNAAIDFLSKLLSSLIEQDAQVLERVIKKDLKCGVSSATINKIWPDLIKEYPCMLASAYDEKLVSKIKFPAMVQLKMDGMRFNAIVKDGSCEFRSRNGKEINLLGRLQQEFISIASGKNMVFDGELVVMDEFDYQYLDRQTGNGILNKAVKGTLSAEEADKVCATLWDIIPYEDFISGMCKMAYQIRFDALKAITSDSGKIRVVENQFVFNIEQAREIFESYLAEGQEGIILKDSKMIWENKRSQKQIKFKGELECDLRVIQFQEGTGKYSGMLGALVCESEDGLLKVDVGSGFKDCDRKDFTCDNILGKIITVKYNSRIKNKQGEESLFLPIFIEVREDKSCADYLEKIK